MAVGDGRGTCLKGNDGSERGLEQGMPEREGTEKKLENEGAKGDDSVSRWEQVAARVDGDKYRQGREISQREGSEKKLESEGAKGDGIVSRQEEVATRVDVGEAKGNGENSTGKATKKVDMEGKRVYYIGSSNEGEH